MIQPDIPGSPLTPEQWRLTQELGQILQAKQALWVSGYFGGLGSLAELPSMPQPASNVADARRLTILYGTETGNSAELSRNLKTAAEAEGLDCIITDMADYKLRRLGQEQDVLIIVSTYGEGDPPQPATGFFEFVEGRKAPRLNDLRFAVLALGDSTYEFYCQAGKRLDERLEELGASRLAPRVDCDIDYDEQASDWIATLVARISEERGLVGASRRAKVSIASGVSSVSPQPAAVRHDKRNPFPATVIDNLPIVGRGSTKETRHIELSLGGSTIRYEPGDALGVAVSNDPDVVSSLIDALSLAPDTSFELKGHDYTLAEVLTHRFEITAATPRFLEYWALLSGSETLRQLQSEDRTGERTVFLRTHHVVDIVRSFPVAPVMPQGFVSALRPLQPRLYSLASSMSATVDEAHITVAPVRFVLQEEPRSGVASCLLADRTPADGVLPVYIQSNPHFRLPEDDAPILMIGAGTGVAPYRAFLQEREARGARGRSWLFFGERNFRTDFLYQTEWQGWLKDGTLERMDVAFSRDRSEKTYVQHRMKERARDIFTWLEDGAHIYVCGDATHLAPDVHRTLIEIVAQEAHTGLDAAEDYVRTLQADHRYQRDVY